MTSLSMHTVAALLFSQMQMGKHVLVVGAGDDAAIGLAMEICWQYERERLHTWQDVGDTSIIPWTGYAYTADHPEQEVTRMDRADMGLMIILDDAVPPWGVYPYGCPVLRVHVDDRYD